MLFLLAYLFFEVIFLLLFRYKFFSVFCSCFFLCISSFLLLLFLLFLRFLRFFLLLFSVFSSFFVYAFFCVFLRFFIFAFFEFFFALYFFYSDFFLSENSFFLSFLPQLFYHNFSDFQSVFLFFKILIVFFLKICYNSNRFLKEFELKMVARKQFQTGFACQPV